MYMQYAGMRHDPMRVPVSLSDWLRGWVVKLSRVFEKWEHERIQVVLVGSCGSCGSTEVVENIAGTLKYGASQERCAHGTTQRKGMAEALFAA